MFTTTFVRSLRAGLLVLLAGASSAVAAVTNQDVIKMKKAGLGEETILLAIQADPGEFDTSAEALIELKKAGISDAIIQRMIAPRSSGAAPTPAAGPARPAAAPGAPGGSDTEIFWGNHPSVAPPFVDPVPGQDYYLRFTLRQEKNQYRVANYGRGIIVPINTRVKLLSISEDTILLQRLDNGAELKVEHEPKYTQKTAAGFATLMLSAEPTELDRLPQKLAAAIRLGEMRRGMTKEQVVMARGYPPAHETPSTESDRWVYWSSRFVKQTVVFTNDRLTDGRGIY